MSYNEFASVYDKLMADMPYDRWLAWVEATWDRFGKPKTAAELGCGTGTLTIPLAERGVHMYGVDISSEMLAVAAAKDYERGLIQWLEQDMAHLQLPEKVDAVYAFCDSLNYIVDETEMCELLSHVHEHLQPSGIFTFDVWSPEQFAWYGEAQPFVWDEEELSYIWTCDFDHESLTIEHQLTIFAQHESGLFRKIEETHVQKAYPTAWIERALGQAGFTRWDIAADFTNDRPNGTAQRIFVTAVA